MACVITMIKKKHNPPPSTTNSISLQANWVSSGCHSELGLIVVCMSVYWLLLCCRVSIFLSCTRTHLYSSCSLPIFFHRKHVASVRMAADSCLVYHSTRNDRDSESNEHLETETNKKKHRNRVKEFQRRRKRQWGTDRVVWFGLVWFGLV